jgi:Skp family chaperone for outer membrane proteins
MFRHPNYYKELEKIRKEFEKKQKENQDSSSKPQASSVKPQAASIKQEPQATSGKHPNPDAMVPASGHRKQES